MKKYLSVIVLGAVFVVVLVMVANNKIQFSKIDNEGAAQRAQSALQLEQAQQTAQLNKNAMLARRQALTENNQELRDNLNLYRNSSTAKKASARTLLEQTLKERHDNILKVIDESPEAVLESVIKPAELAGLPSDLADKYIEKETTVTNAKMLVMHEDGKIVPGTNAVDASGTRYRYYVENNNATSLTELHIAGQPNSKVFSGAKTGKKVSVSKGIKVDNQIVAYNINLQLAAMGGNGGGSSPISSPTSTVTTSPHNMLVIVTNYADTAPYNSTTISQLQNMMFGPTNSVTDFYKENSYNATNIDAGTVVGPVTIPYNFMQIQAGGQNLPANGLVCTTSYYNSLGQEVGLGKKVIDAAHAAGISTNGYSHVVVVTPTSNCSFAGIASIGTPLVVPELYQPSIMINGFDVASTAILNIFNHEIGHAYGLPHAHALVCNPGSAYGATTCNTNGIGYEYGDVYDTMGISMHGGVRTGSPHFNALYKKMLGWLDNALISAPTITQVTTSGDYTINKYETGGGAKAISFTEPLTGSTYFLESRTGIGHDTNVANGVTVRVNPNVNLTNYTLTNGIMAYPDLNIYDNIYDSILIDTKPNTLNFPLDDALLTATGASTGDVYATPESGTNFRLVSKDANTATIHVNVVPTCSRAPSVVVTPYTQIGVIGQTYTNSVIITNNDLPGCPTSTFNVRQMLHSGVKNYLNDGVTRVYSYTHFPAYTVTLAPGASSSPQSIQSTHLGCTGDTTNEMGVYVENAAKPVFFGAGKYTLRSNSNDLTAPIISNDATANLGLDHVTINWTTDDCATTEVLYRQVGTSSDSSSGISDTYIPVTAHTASLIGLTPNTNYQYKMISTSAGGTTTSPLKYFTTPDGTIDTTIPVVSIQSPTTGANVSGTVMFTINATDDISVSSVKIVNSFGGQLGSTDYTAPYQIYVDMTTVPPGPISVRAVATDGNNNTGQSTLITLNVGVPEIQNVSATTHPVNPTIEQIHWTTNVQTDHNHTAFGTSAGALNQSGTANQLSSGTDHNDLLYGLTLGNTYYYKVYSTSLSVGGYSTTYTTESPVYSFVAGATTASYACSDNIDNDGDALIDMQDPGCANATDNDETNGDTTAPIISAISVPTVTLTATTAIVNWTTNEPADTQVVFGPTSGYGSAMPTIPTTSMTLPHSVNISGLSPNTTYHFAVKSKDPSNNLATSSDQTFTTTGDTIAPTVAITSPTGGTLSGTTNIVATATDNIGVDHVDFYRGTTLIGGAATSPYTVSWNTTTVANGSYTLTARAYDAAGNNTTSSGVTVTVNNIVVIPDTTAPTATITSHHTGDIVSGIVTITATASDLKNDGSAGTISKVEFYRGTTLIDIDTTAPYAVTWNTTLLTNGYKYLNVKAYDGASPANTYKTPNAKVTVSNVALVACNDGIDNDADGLIDYPLDPGCTSPTDTNEYNAPIDTIAPNNVSITNPTSGTISGTQLISATASDNVGVTKVEFYRDGTTLMATDTTVPYSYNFDSTTVANGNHTFTVKAYDAANLTTVSSVVTLSVSNTIVDNQNPIVTMTAPTPGTVSGTITLSANASDNVGVTKVEFYGDSAVLLATDTVAPYAYSWNTATSSNGAHTIYAKAYDAANNTATTPTVSITIANNTGSNNAPVVDVFGDTNTVSMSVGNHMYATVTDSDGPAPLTIVWTKISGPGTVTWSNSASPTSNVTFSMTGVYVMRLTATDGGGASAYDQTAWTVNP